MLHDIRTAERAVRAYIEDERIPGAVLLVGHGDQVDYLSAFGAAQWVPHRIEMKEDTLFDMASLTKVMAVWPLVVVLLQEGRITLHTTLGALLPDWPLPNEVADITLLQLLTHTAGFIPFADTQGNTREQRILSLLTMPLACEPGSKCTYSDFSFIALGEAMAAGMGEPLDEAAARVFMALGMDNTLYRPDPMQAFAATEVVNGVTTIGTVHDERAQQLGGVAGHAGLFSTAMDVHRFAAAFLATPRHPLFQNEWVDKSFRNHLAIAPDYAIGWAIRGRSASSGRIVGHTGFTGTSLHFSPRTGAHVVLLTNRVHPTRENMHIADLRREVLNAIFGRIDEV